MHFDILFYITLWEYAVNQEFFKWRYEHFLIIFNYFRQQQQQQQLLSNDTIQKSFVDAANGSWKADRAKTWPTHWTGTANSNSMKPQYTCFSHRFHTKKIYPRMLTKWSTFSQPLFLLTIKICYLFFVFLFVIFLHQIDFFSSHVIFYF